MGRNLRKMKVVILAGGFGTRITEESHLIPKPMIPLDRQICLYSV
jgi:glucose-1-phosphate cytidylyltransferase